MKYASSEHNYLITTVIVKIRCHQNVQGPLIACYPHVCLLFVILAGSLVFDLNYLNKIAILFGFQPLYPY